MNLYNPCQVRVAAPRGPTLGEYFHETCGQDVVPDGRSNLCNLSASRSGGSNIGGRCASTMLHRTRVPLEASI